MCAVFSVRIALPIFVPPTINATTGTDSMGQQHLQAAEGKNGSELPALELPPPAANPAPHLWLQLHSPTAIFHLSRRRSNTSLAIGHGPVPMAAPHPLRIINRIRYFDNKFPEPSLPLLE